MTNDQSKLLLGDEPASLPSTALEDATGDFFRLAVSSAFDAVMVTTTSMEPPDPRILYVNAAFERMSGYTSAEIVGRDPRILQGPLTDMAVMRRLKDDVEAGREFHGQTVNYRKDGAEYHVEWRLSEIRDGERLVARMAIQREVTREVLQAREIAEASCQLAKANAELVTQRDLLDERLLETAEMNIMLEAQRYQLAAANELLATLATRDGLTGILNHRSFQERLGIEIERSRRSGDALSIALMDVDRFKAFNDEHGHQAGDTVLRAVAETLTESARNIDVVARYGGEEFVAILPGAGAEVGFKVSERLRREIEAIDLEFGRITASFGVATLRPAMSQEELIEAADRAMYLSKETGRNRTTSAA